MSAPSQADQNVASRVAGLMPALLDDLATLVAIPSVAFPGFPEEPVHRMGEAAVELMQRSGATNARLLPIPGGYPAVWAEIPAPEGAPTVTLYAHYDVQPAPKEQGWDTEPFVATCGSDGRIYGRGAADDKSGIVIHAGTLQILGAEPPVGIKILIEGEEETDSHLEAFVDANPEMFDCDAFMIADMGNQAVGRPALTTALRGGVSCTVKVRTLAFPVHSGVAGGAAPDALIALIKILASLHDDDGNTIVPGLDSGPWDGADVDVDETVFRESSGLLEGVDLVGSGTLASRLWAKPSANVIGIDAPNVAEAANILIPEATAKISMRIAPGSDADRQLDLLLNYLQAQAPWNVEVTVTNTNVGWPFVVDMTGTAVQAAEAGLAEAFGREVETIGCGGSIPLINSLNKACPRADVILWGAEDVALSRIHASNESVDPAEIEKMIIAQVLTLQRLASTARRSS
jgi:acetylornithine deacetylase/succinyl-diaminopimelate desuccinylase-like protein